jgi:predicted DNA-binding transcriptional regulator AlpA
MSKQQTEKPIRRAKISGTHVIHPRGVEQRYGFSSVTRWRYEKTGKLPPRDVFIGGVAVGWKPSTLESAERGTATGQTAA